jgi:hypothetical protein
MKKHHFPFFLVMMLALAGIAPYSASAHEHQTFKIGAKYYQFTVGSLNEPIAVDDKTGVDLKVELVSQAEAMEERHEEEAGHTETTPVPVAGLEKTLKVELGAGSVKKVLSLAPAFNSPGSYRAMFIPTLETTYTYRFFGTIDSMPVDLSFTCNPVGEAVPQVTPGVLKLSDSVERISKTGAYGCPLAKADLGFPEKSAAVADLKTQDADLKTAAGAAETKADSARSLGMLAIAASVLGLVAGGGAWLKRPKT